MDRECLFVAGCPRSGTSLLRSAVSEHDQIAVAPERFNLRAFRGELSGADFSYERFFDIRKGDTWYDSLDQWSVTYDGLRAKYAHAKVVGDKIPRAFTMFSQLSRVFPDTRFLVTFRNIFAVAASYKGALAENEPLEPPMGLS